MFILKSEIEFDASHFLSGYDGKCSNIHGHRYRLVVKVSGKKLHESGSNRAMVEDFHEIKKALKEIHDIFDHKLIVENDCNGREVTKLLDSAENKFDYVMVPYRPTAEEMSRDIYKRIKATGIDVYEVELFETPTCSCIYTERE